MADIVVPLVLENLIKLLTYEANLLLGVEDQVNLLKDDLRFMNAFLESSAGKRNSRLLKELVEQITDAALESEDVVETYASRVIKQRRRNLLAKLLHWIGDASTLHVVGNKTTSIKNKIKNIYENNEIYDIGEADQSTIDAEAQQLLQRRRRNVEEDDVVGFVNDTTTLVNQLTDPRNLQREVFSIIGTGGLGKTTLARRIYDNTRVKDHFDCCAWINVSQEWQTKSLLLEILRSFKHITEETLKNPDEKIKEELFEKLQGTRYLIVMDDMWSPQVWDEVGVAFPDDSNGSRILITSRHNEIASHATSTPPYFLPFLDDDKSWELLCKKVFRGGECPSNLETLGRQLAKSCQGLPLSIVLLGGILATIEKSHGTWSRFIGNVNSHLQEGIDIMTISYNHLPRHLKPCFLYLGMFPEDYEINAMVLTELWVAEGFIQPIGNMSVVDVAEEYLEQLIDRSLIQLARKRSDGGVKTCRIHDLLRDLCIKESRQDKFLEFYSRVSSSFSSKSRRFSFQHFSKESLLYVPCTARSLLLFNSSEYIRSPNLTKVFISSKFIRVLCLINTDIRKIPRKIEQLVFLRCLMVGAIHCLPSSVGNLQYLETIHLENHSMPLPASIWSVMKNLRTIYVQSNNYFQLSNPPRRLMGECFWNLQVLYGLEVNHNTALVVSKFPNIRILRLNFSEACGPLISDSEVENIMTRIGKLESLQSFKLIYVPRDNRVCVRLNSVQSTLTKISLTYYNFDWGHFKALARLPNVRVLKLKSTVSWEQADAHTVIEGDFPQLEVLKIRGTSIRTFRMEKNAMPNLQRLIIRRNDTLICLPDELWSITTLQLVEVSEVSYALRITLGDFKMTYSGACNIIIN